MSLEEAAVALREARDSLAAEEKQKLFFKKGMGDYGGWATEIAEKYWPDQPEERLTFLNVCGRAHVASYGMAEVYLGDDMAYEALAAAVRGLPADRAKSLIEDCGEASSRMSNEDELDVAEVLERLARFVEEALATD